MVLLDAVQYHEEGQPILEDLIALVPEEVQEVLRSLNTGDPLPEEVRELVLHA